MVFYNEVSGNNNKVCCNGDTRHRRKGIIWKNNLLFVSTKTLKEDYAKPFCFLMDASMLGVGVGFDTKGEGEIVVKGVNQKKRPTNLSDT